MAVRRSTRLTTIALTVSAVSAAAIIACVAYNTSAPPADANSSHVKEVAAPRPDQQEVGALKTEIGSLPSTLDSAVAAAQQTISSTAGRADDALRGNLQNAIDPAKTEVAAAAKSSLALTNVSEVRSARDAVKTLCAEDGTKIENARIATETNAAENDAARQSAQESQASQAKRDADEAAAIAARQSAQEKKPVQPTQEPATANASTNTAEAQPTNAPCPCSQHPCPGRPCPCTNATGQQAEREPSAPADSTTADAEQTRSQRVQAVSGSRWEAQSANSLRSGIESTVSSIEQAVSEAQATVDSTSGRATDDSRSKLQTVIDAAKNAGPAERASVTPQTDASDLCGALARAKRLAATHKDELANAKKIADDQAAAFDAAEAKRKADAEEAAKAASSAPNSPVSSATPVDATGKDATALCLSGRGAEGAIACVKALASGVPVTVEWGNPASSGWSGVTWFTKFDKSAMVRVKLSDSIASDFGENPGATSVAMHEAGHAANQRCPALADDPVFSQRSSNDNPAERFATAFAISHGSPSRDASGESAYQFQSTDAEIAKAAQC